MAGILDLLGGSKNTNLSPAGGVGSAGPAYAPTAPVPGASANPFSNAMLASDAPGLLGILGKLAGNPTGDEIMMQRLGGAQAQGLAAFQKRIASGMTPQQAIVDFIGSPEGQQFFGTSQDPMGALKGYLQLSQKPADKFSTISPGAGVLNESTGQVTAGQPTTQAQDVDKFMALADLDPQQARDVGRAFLNKMSTTQENKTQKEASIDWLVAQGIVDKTMGEKMKAGIITLNQPRDAAGNPLGPPIAIDLTNVMATGDPNAVRMVPVGGKNGGAAGDLPQGTPTEPDGTPVKVPGDIIFGAGITGNAGRVLGGWLGNFSSKLSAPAYNQYKTALSTINSDVQNLLSVNKNLAAEMKTYSEMVDRDGWGSNPIEQGIALSNLWDIVDRRTALLSQKLSSPDPTITGSTRDRMSQEMNNLQKLAQDLPSREDLQAAIVRAQGGEGSVAFGIKEGATHVQEAIDSAKTTLDAARGAASATEKTVEGQTGSGGGNVPMTFKTEQEAAAAAKAGKIKAGDRITVGGQTGTWSD